ncbi:hypothetical protein PBCVCviKI_715R [Paramecium bursaria Chlorella virus CviKI]|nr:hypothetical protein PBCVCviKI_715R [Paramecium bursaria Chlorella virus CviKI]
MKIVIRGHIRNSFSSDELYNMLKILTETYDVEIFIHTWNRKQNDVSWRQIEDDDTEINTEVIRSYFRDVFKFVKAIIIEDDADILLYGNVEGNMASTRTNLLGWKRYIYGQFKATEMAYVDSDNPGEFLLNTRFDLFTNSFVFPVDEILEFIRKNYHDNHTRNIFLRSGHYCGIDNIIIGSVESNYKLLRYIHTSLDNILDNNKLLRNPEFIIPIANDTIFGSSQ